MKNTHSTSANLKSIFTRIGLLALFFLFFSLSARAGNTFTWTGTAGDGKWSTANNWDRNSSYPGAASGDAVIFNTANPSVTLDVAPANALTGISINSSCTGTVAISNNSGTYNLLTTGSFTFNTNSNVTFSLTTGITITGTLDMKGSGSATANVLKLCDYVSASGTPTTNTISGSLTNMSSTAYITNQTINNKLNFIYSGSSSTIYTAASLSFYRLTLSGSGSLTMGNSFTAARIAFSSTAAPALTIGANTLQLGDGSSNSLSFTKGAIDASNSSSKIYIYPTASASFSASNPLFYSASGNATVNELEFNGSLLTLTLDQSINVNKLDLDAGTLTNSSTNNITITSGGTITVAGGTLAVAPSLPGNINVTANASCASGFELPSTSTGTLTVNAGFTYTLAGNTTFGTVTTASATSVLNLSTYTLGGTPTINNTGTIKTSYVGAAAIPAVSYGTTGTVQYAVTGQTVVATTYNNLTLTSNTTAASGTITLNGNWSNSGTFTPGTNTVTFSGGGSQSITGATTFYNLSTATSNTNLTVGSAITISTFLNVAASTTLQLGAALTLSTAGTGSTGSNIVGTLQLNSGGSVVTNAPYYTSASTLIYNTGATANVATEWAAGNTSGQAGVPNNVQIGNGVASSAFSFNGSSSSYTMTGNLNITSNTGATLTFGTSGTATLNIGGNFSNSGTFTPVSGTVNFNGSGTQTITTGQTFYGLTISNSSVTFPTATTSTNLTIAASITQPVSTTITTANLIINTGITFTQSPASTASQSTNTAGSNNAVFNMNSGANTITLGNSSVLSINGWFKSAIGSGTITIGTGAAINVNSNAVYNCSGSGSNVPAATWATTSTLYFSGIAGSAPTMPTTVNTYGNII